MTTTTFLESYRLMRMWGRRVWVLGWKMDRLKKDKKSSITFKERGTCLVMWKEGLCSTIVKRKKKKKIAYIKIRLDDRKDVAYFAISTDKEEDVSIIFVWPNEINKCFPFRFFFLVEHACTNVAYCRGCTTKVSSDNPALDGTGRRWWTRLNICNALYNRLCKETLLPFFLFL